MDLSIIIPCKDDPKIVHCVSSIDDHAEIVIVFNGSTELFQSTVRSDLKNRPINYQVLDESNLPWALQHGIEQAVNEYVLLMDSDCVFADGSLNAFRTAIAEGHPLREVYKGQVHFMAGDGIISLIIAKSRQHHTAETLTAYKPPLAFSKYLNKDIGGYFFDRRLLWREDSDLDNRLRQAGISIAPVPDGAIYHGPIEFTTDLRSTFRYGIGGAIARHLKIKLTEVPRSVISSLKSQGLLPALYMIFRNRFYTIGYLYMRIRLLIRPL